MGYLYLLVFKVIFRSFGTFVSIWPVTRKLLAVERNGVNLSTGVVLASILALGVYLTFSSVHCYFAVINSVDFSQYGM